MHTVTDRALKRESPKRAFYGDPNSKPVIAAPRLGNIPVLLCEERRWILWKFVWKSGRWTKVPYQPNGHPAKSNDPSTWVWFEEVVRAYRRGGFSGIGFVLGGGYVGIDIDDCRDPNTGRFTSSAKEIGKRLGTYAEISPSNTGVKLICRGEWHGDWHRKPLPDGDGEIEVYGDCRFFTITSDRIGDADVADIQPLLDELAERFATGRKEFTPAVARTEGAVVEDDDALIRRARAGKFSKKFVRLWHGDASGYESASEADLALCGILAYWTGGDRGQIDRLFRRSGLMRDKWDEKRGSSTYGARTISAALARTSAFYTPGTDGSGPERPKHAESNPPTALLPTIVIDTDEHRVNDQAVAALATEPDVYQRGGLLVRVTATRAEPRIDAAIRRPAGATIIRELLGPTLRERLTRCARFVTFTDDSPKPAHPTGWCIQAVLARGDWLDIRRLEALVPHPALLGDGSILSANGYDPQSGLLVCVSPALDVAVPNRPTRADVRGAVAELFDLVCDFPFARPEHRAAWLASLLTPLAWFAFEGPAPLFLIDKNVRGAGAGLLADTVSLIVTGRRFSVMSYTPEREELRKRITSMAKSGERLALLDNLTGTVGNDVLDAALTGDWWRDRLLGGNQVYDGPLHICWYGTGNNVQLAADTARRVCHIRMETADERPEERTGFRYPRLRAHVRENRGRLLGAALTILRGWFAAGRPRHGLTPWGSFEGWSDTVREAVVFAGLPDPGETRQALQTTADRDAVAMAALLSALEDMDPHGMGVTAAAVIDRVKAPPPSPEWVDDLRAAVEELCGRVDGRALGYQFRRFQRRNFGGRMLDKASTVHGSGRWVVVPTDGISDRRKHVTHVTHHTPEHDSDG